MSALLAIHRVVGLAFGFASAIMAIWALVQYRRRAPLPSPYWHALRGTAALLAIQIILGVGFAATHHYPKDGLHFMYAALVTAGVAAEELLRPTASLGRILREEGHFQEAVTYAALTGLVALLTLRLWQTG